MVFARRTMPCFSYRPICLVFCLILYTNASVKLQNASVENGAGILVAENTQNKFINARYCILYNPQFHSLPAQRSEAETMTFVDWTIQSFDKLCSDLDPPPQANGSAVAVLRGGGSNCSFSEKARRAIKYGGGALIIVSSEGLIQPGAAQISDYEEINITVALMTAKDFDNLKELGDSLLVTMYRLTLAGADYNLVIIWLCAVGTVIVGSYWSGLVRYQIWLHKIGLTVPGTHEWQIAEKEGKDEMPMTAAVAAFGVLLMIAMILGLYFFYDYLVYVIIVLFALAASAALYDCISSALGLLRPFATCRLPENRIPLLKSQPQVKELVLMGLCLGVGIWWIVERHASYAWILQDILGMCFCVQMMKKIRLSSLKVCFTLLVLLFVYDIFFVFITPLFTKNGRSVMIDVATGGSSQSGELLPMVLLVPRLIQNDGSVCSRPYSLLGFGDILVPGLLVSFCHGFDLQVRSRRRIYFVSTTISYGVGLVVTFIALALMKQGQPALLYLVPFTLLTTFIVGCRRGEVSQLWSGKPLLTRIERSLEDYGDIGQSLEDESEKFIQNP